MYMYIRYYNYYYEVHTCILHSAWFECILRHTSGIFPSTCVYSIYLALSVYTSSNNNQKIALLVLSACKPYISNCIHDIVCVRYDKTQHPLLTRLPALKHRECSLLHIHLDPTGNLVVAEVALLSVSVRIECLSNKVLPGVDPCNINPLAVEIARITVTAIWRNSLLPCERTLVPKRVSRRTLGVFQTERGFVPLGYFLSRLDVKEVEVDKRLIGVVVLVTVMKYPVLPVQVGLKVAQTPVERNTVKLQQSST